MSGPLYQIAINRGDLRFKVSPSSQTWEMLFLESRSTFLCPRDPSHIFLQLYCDRKIEHALCNLKTQIMSTSIQNPCASEEINCFKVKLFCISLYTKYKLHAQKAGSSTAIKYLKVWILKCFPSHTACFQTLIPDQIIIPLIIKTYASNSLLFPLVPRCLSDSDNKQVPYL